MTVTQRWKVCVKSFALTTKSTGLTSARRFVNKELTRAKWFCFAANTFSPTRTSTRRIRFSWICFTSKHATQFSMELIRSPKTELASSPAFKFTFSSETSMTTSTNQASLTSRTSCLRRTFVSRESRRRFSLSIANTSASVNSTRKFRTQKPLESCQLTASRSSWWRRRCTARTNSCHDCWESPKIPCCVSTNEQRKLWKLGLWRLSDVGALRPTHSLLISVITLINITRCRQQKLSKLCNWLLVTLTSSWRRSKAKITLELKVTKDRQWWKKALRLSSELKKVFFVILKLFLEAFGWIRQEQLLKLFEDFRCLKASWEILKCFKPFRVSIKNFQQFSYFPFSFSIQSFNHPTRSDTSWKSQRRVRLQASVDPRNRRWVSELHLEGILFQFCSILFDFSYDFP